MDESKAELTTEVKTSIEQAAKALVKAGGNVYKPEPSREDRVACVNAVADYLVACADAGITEHETTKEHSHYSKSERHYFNQNDRQTWRAIAAVMRKPKSANNLETVGMLAALREQADNFKDLREQGERGTTTRNLWCAYHEAWRFLNGQVDSLGTGDLAGVSLP